MGRCHPPNWLILTYIYSCKYTIVYYTIYLQLSLPMTSAKVLEFGTFLPHSWRCKNGLKPFATFRLFGRFGNGSQVSSFFPSLVFLKPPTSILPINHSIIFNLSKGFFWGGWLIEFSRFVDKISGESVGSPARQLCTLEICHVATDTVLAQGSTSTPRGADDGCLLLGRFLFKNSMSSDWLNGF